MLRWVVFSLSCILLVTAHVWHPYIIAGCMHWLYTFLFRHIGILLFSISLYFANAPHPAAILLLISSVLSFSIFTNCPKYTYSVTPSTSSVPICTGFLLTYSLYITLVFFIFIFIPNFLLSEFISFNISCSSSQLLLISTMSSANLR